MFFTEDEVPGKMDPEYWIKKLEDKEKVNKKKREERRNEGNKIYVKPVIQKNVDNVITFRMAKSDEEYQMEETTPTSTKLKLESQEEKELDDEDVVFKPRTPKNINIVKESFVNQINSSSDEEDLHEETIIANEPEKSRKNSKPNIQRPVSWYKSSANQNNSEFLDLLSDGLDKFVFTPVPQSYECRCIITRDNRGIEKGIYPSYYMHLELDQNRKVFLLAARKRKRIKTAYYTITIDPVDLNRDGENFVGKLRSNLIGTNFTLYNNGISPEKCSNNQEPRSEMASIIYEKNILGLKGPRKMIVVMPGMINETKRTDIKPKNEKESIIERWKNKNLNELTELSNKAPVWNDEIQTYTLNYIDRTIKASVKNFQIVHPSDQNYIIMQFGKIEQHKFICDFNYPMCAIQAFGIALSSLNSKLAVD